MYIKKFGIEIVKFLHSFMPYATPFNKFVLTHTHTHTTQHTHGGPDLSNVLLSK